MGYGAFYLVVGVGGTILTYNMANAGQTYVIFWGAIAVGLINLAIGFYQWVA